MVIFVLLFQTVSAAAKDGMLSNSGCLAGDLESEVLCIRKTDRLGVFCSVGVPENRWRL